MRSTLYCHCMEGYTGPYLELVYQHTTFKTEQSRCQQTITTSINSVSKYVIWWLILLYWVKLSCSSMFMHVTNINNTSPTGQLCYQNLAPVAESSDRHQTEEPINNGSIWLSPDHTLFCRWKCNHPPHLCRLNRPAPFGGNASSRWLNKHTCMSV